jgi:hypothetical protein
VLSVLLRITDSDYPFGIFKLFLPLWFSCIFLERPILKYGSFSRCFILFVVLNPCIVGYSTDLPQVRDKFVSHKLVPSTAQSAAIELITLVMTDSECYYVIAILFYYCSVSQQVNMSPTRTHYHDVQSNHARAISVHACWILVDKLVIFHNIL